MGAQYDRNGRLGPYGGLGTYGRHGTRGRIRRAGSQLVAALTVTAATVLGPAAGAAVAAGARTADTVGPDPSLRQVQVHPGEMARTGATTEQLWLMGGVALSLSAAGVVAVAASRGRRRH
ncbi:hypothetical protein [Streptomyces sp. NPDC002889]|uniref:hypothetical protein n=1 Tax=Streptomyces sp. NPDC002889 TaxID=3364669 RepID=UPI0036AC98AF